ncbi:MAG: hypothetical protein HKM89_01350 [Gemmatimonadales bacterium]|nr:hypothetical protein [Gemmatimonadales bacterium]
MIAVSVALIAVGLLIPSAWWIDLLRPGPVGSLQGELLLGASLWRVGLVLMGLWLAAAARWHWWRDPESSRPATQISRSERWVLAGILLLALILRLYRLGEGLWVDEVATLINYVRQPFGVILTTYDSENQHFVISLLARAVISVTGESAWALRLPAVLFGVAGIWALYRFALEVTTRREAFQSAALLTVAYHHVWFSQNARGYSGVLFWTLLSSWLLLRALRAPRSRLWFAYGLAVAVGAYTHLTMIFVAAGHFLIFLADTARQPSAPGRARWIPLASGFGLSAILAYTLFSFGLPQFISTALQEESLVATWKDPLWTLRETIRMLHLASAKGAVGIVGLGVLGLGLASYWRDRPVVVALLLVPVVLVSATAIGMGHHLWPRTVFFSAGFGILILIRGLGDGARWLATVLRLPDRARDYSAQVAVGIAILVSTATLPFAYGPKQDFLGARDFINAERASGDRVATVGVAQYPYEMLFGSEWEAVNTRGDLAALRAEASRVWVVYTFPLHMASEHPGVLEVLETEYDFVRHFSGSLGGGAIYVYRSPAEQSGAETTHGGGPSADITPTGAGRHHGG